jgi:hypothetical protein
VDLLLLCFYGAFGLYVISFVLSVSRSKYLHSYVWHTMLFAFILNGLAIGFSVSKPVYIPRSLELGFGLIILLWMVSLFQDIERFQRLILFMIVTLFVADLFSSGTFRTYTDLYSVPWGLDILFHQLESMAFLFMTFSSGYCLLYLFENKSWKDPAFSLHSARNFMLVGFILFLTSQYFGSIWALKGWGDYWLWNQRFFISASVWLYAMFFLHLRLVSSWSNGIKALFGAGTFGVLILLGWL